MSALKRNRRQSRERDEPVFIGKGTHIIENEERFARKQHLEEECLEEKYTSRKNISRVRGCNRATKSPNDLF